MAEDTWLMDVVQRLRRARTRDEILELIERLEDQYDAFSGPGQELMDGLLDEARQKLRNG